MAKPPVIEPHEIRHALKVAAVTGQNTVRDVALLTVLPASTRRCNCTVIDGVAEAVGSNVEEQGDRSSPQRADSISPSVYIACIRCPSVTMDKGLMADVPAALASLSADSASCGTAIAQTG